MGSVAPLAAARFLVIGAGSRGEAYAKSVQAATSGVVAAVAEPIQSKRERFGRKYIWGDDIPREGQAFSDWSEFIAWETKRRQNFQPGVANGHNNITGVFICTLDDTHADIIRALAPLNLHIMCEKPLALSLTDCLSISHTLSQYPPKVFSVGHVLRYSPHNMTLRKLVVTDQAIGEIISIEHTEPVGWWHFAHSYVRGNWRRAVDDGVGSLLTKSCHDIDFILWMLCSPSELTGSKPHLPSSITSQGAVSHFRRARKPKLAGNATNCSNCAAESTCIYSARKIYVENQLKGQHETGWPVKIVMPDIEDVVKSSGWEVGESQLLQKLGEDYDRTKMTDDEIAQRGWYGRCVYECDNDVVDDQTVLISWDEDVDTNLNDQRPQQQQQQQNNNQNNDTTSRPQGYGRGPKRATFHMTYPTQSRCDRRGKIYGSLGEITYDSHKIDIYTFVDDQMRTIEIPKQDPEVEKSHGGGDRGLAGAFVRAVQAVDQREMSVDEAQRSFVGCDVEEVIRSHALVFAAEEARIEKKFVDWMSWCAEKGI